MIPSPMAYVRAFGVVFFVGAFAGASAACSWFGSRHRAHF